MSDETVFRFGSEEWVLFGNALNEVLHGFTVPDFERTIGADKAGLDALLIHLNTLDRAEALVLGVKEMRAIRNALQETIRKIRTWEFHTRTGYELERAKEVLAKLDRLLTG